MDSQIQDLDETIWPPPPLGSDSVTISFPFRSLDVRLKGTASGFHHGWIGFGAGGLTIHGKMDTNTKWLMLFLFLSIPFRNYLPPRVGLCLLAVIIVSIPVLKLLRKSTAIIISWSQVQQIVVDEQKHRIGLVYIIQDRTEVTKTHSLVFSLKTALYLSFVDNAEKYAPTQSHRDKLRGQSMAVPLFLLVHGLLVVFLALFLSKLFMGHH